MPAYFGLSQNTPRLQYLMYYLPAGLAVTDATVPRGVPNRRFRCRVCLLFWVGDYPALAAVSGIHSKMCHWCQYKSDPCPEATRRVWGDYRRMLPLGDSRREASRVYGPDEERGPPPLRTHNQIVADGLANEEHRKKLQRPDARRLGIFKKDYPYKTTGVKFACPLRFLPMFDLAWDFMMDMMHAVPGVFGRHIVACMQGQRKPAKPKWRTTWTDKKNYDLVWEWEKCCKDLESWKLTEEEGKAMDARSLALAGDPSWIRSNVEVFSGKGLTSHDWFQLVLAAGEYIFAGLYPNNLLRMEAIFGLITCVQAMLKMQSPFDVDDRAELNELKLQVVSALVECEATLPRTELPVMLHLMAHVPDAIYRWNQVRNFWCFFSERSALSFYYLYQLASAHFGLRRLTPCMFGRTSA